MDAETLRLLITGTTGVSGAVFGSLVVGLLNRATARETRKASEDSESLAWTRAQDANRETWLRDERKRTHMAFFEVVADLMVVAASHPGQARASEWPQEYWVQNTEVYSRGSRLLTEMQLLCEPATYNAAGRMFGAKIRLAEMISQNPKSVSPPGTFDPETDMIMLNVELTEAGYLAQIRKELAIPGEVPSVPSPAAP
ncbi:hypothetical protein QEH68_01330 [Paenarthrobacter sp. OM7]|uniref:Uncharacterized protein n=1 Tax=Paenarthrobacter sp. AMU7 TaxID=3162492 RepID=A0AB39YPY7_9MICC|nr:hypothetical protein [Paenarthrobacter sp. OM7]WGM20860.1 hypothetical protein QEH68_01330 [Paenarthrobacter sp. OM7]